jgi:hypothetical protein
MASSLQKQLTKINGGKEKKKNMHPSLLFEKSKDVSVREVYELARPAFEEFCVLDPRFNEFLELFSMHRLSVPRMAMVISLLLILDPSRESRIECSY